MTGKEIIELLSEEETQKGLIHSFFESLINKKELETD